MASTGFTEEQEENLHELGELVFQVIDDNDLRDHRDTTGFVPMYVEGLLEYMEAIINSGVKKDTISLELGCGAGTWTLFASSLGFPSYGIDINPELVDAAKHIRDIARKTGLMDPSVPCEFAVGNFFTDQYLFEQREFLMTEARYRGAWKKQGDPYKELGIDIKDAGIIYTWPWPQEIKVAGDFLSREAADSAIVVLPYYPDQSSLKLSPLRRLHGGKFGFDSVVGVKMTQHHPLSEEVQSSTPAKELPYHVGDIVSFDRQVSAWEGTISAGSQGMIYKIHNKQSYNSPSSTYCEVELAKFRDEKRAKNGLINLFLTGIENIVEALDDEQPRRSSFVNVCLGDIGGIVKKFDNAEYARELGIVPQETTPYAGGR
jgi:hypothetical protein